MRERRRKHDDTHIPFGCASHAPRKDWDMVSSAIDADERIARGEHQEQCAKCLLWFWPDERGDGFVATGVKDTG